ncbi:MAG: hypothetical protein KAV00_01055 [Phycisphaerae bacterium]|nr:hypothetical protein [Phycisphaerae bacterium]
MQNQESQKKIGNPMARKRQKRKKSSVLEYRRLSTEELHHQIEQCGTKGDVRTAIEMGKECYRRDACPKHVQLLGELYVRRARELASKSLHVEAFSVLNHALGLGYGNQELLHLAFECGLQGGQYEPAMEMLNRLQEPKLRSQAAMLLVDEAVAQGNGDNRFCEPGVYEDASRIRRAFAALECGDDSVAAAELKPIGLRSPCAGWKWVVLGLLAYYRNQEANARSCWTRVGADGRAGQLAGILLSRLDDGKQPDDTRELHTRNTLLSSLANPRIALLEEITQTSAQGDDAHTLRLAKQLLAAISRDDRKSYARRLSRALVSALEWEPDTCRQFQKVFEAFPEDPDLLRTTAIKIEDEAPDEALEFWECYLEELPRVKVIPSRLRPRARALIWRRMGDVVCRIESMREDMSPFAGFPDFAPEHSIPAALYYRNSIKHYPNDLHTHEKLLSALKDSEGRKAIERQAEEIVSRWPTHIDSLLLLGENCFHRQAFRKALKYFDQARAAEPFNTRINHEMQACLLHSARRRLSKGNFDLARKDYMQAVEVGYSRESSTHVYCQWAVLEWRVGNPAEAERLYAQAEDSTEHLIVLYYQMVIELERAGVTQEVRGRFGKLLKAEWENKSPGGAQVAAMSEMAQQYYGILGEWLNAHEALSGGLGNYLKRACKKTEFTEEQLLKVCRYLIAAKNWELLERFARRGVDQFCANFFFPMFLGQALLDMGKWPLPKKTARLLQAAGQRASQAGEHKVAAEIAAIVLMCPDCTPGGISGFVNRLLFGSENDDFANLGDELFGDFDDDDFDDAEPPPPMQRRYRKPDRDQMSLFGDDVSPEVEGP